MCFKAEIQKKNEEKLDEKFMSENVPMFIQEAVVMGIASRAARLNMWRTIREMLLWMMDRSYIKKDTIADIESSDLDSVMPLQMMKYLEYLLNDKGISRDTFLTNKNQLSSFWGKLQNRRYTKDNIVSLVDSSEFKAAKTNRGKEEKQPLPEEIAELMKRLKQKPDVFLRTRNTCILRVLLGTGLRVSELVGLDIADIYLDEKYLDARHPRPYLLVLSKGNYDYTEAGKDIVYLTRDATNAFKEWFEIRSTLENIVDEDAVFVNKTGKRTSIQNVKDMFRINSGGKLSPHMMRHEYTKELKRESNDPVFVQEQGRWKSQAMMNNVYDSGTARSIHVLDRM